MEGKTIVKVLELGESVVLLKMDDGTYISAKIIDPEIPADDIQEFFDDVLTKSAKEEKKGKSEKAGKSTTEDDDITWESLSDMKSKALIKLIDDKTLIVDAEDFKDDDDGLRKAIAEELGITIPKKSKEDTSSEPEGSDYTWEDLIAMDYDELSSLCTENKLDTDPGDFEEDKEEDKFRRAIATECGIKAPPSKKLK